MLLISDDGDDGSSKLVYIYILHFGKFINDQFICMYQIHQPLSRPPLHFPLLPVPAQHNPLLLPRRCCSCWRCYYLHKISEMSVFFQIFVRITTISSSALLLLLLSFSPPLLSLLLIKATHYHHYRFHYNCHHYHHPQHCKRVVTIRPLSYRSDPSEMNIKLPVEFFRCRA